MDQEITKTVLEFGLTLVERQHQFFLDESIDNSEHVPAIRRIADSAHAYLKSLGIPSERCNKVKKDLIARGRDLFIEEWMRSLDEDEGPPDEEGRQEARRTFDQLLRGD